MKKYLLLVALVCVAFPAAALDPLGVYSVRPPEGCVDKNVTEEEIVEYGCQINAERNKTATSFNELSEEEREKQYIQESTKMVGSHIYSQKHNTTMEIHTQMAKTA